MSEGALSLIPDLLGGWNLAHFRVHGSCDEALEAPFTGSLIRGAFGAALFRIACVRKGTPCSACDLRSACIYPRFFECRAAEADPSGRIQRNDADGWTGSEAGEGSPAATAPGRGRLLSLERGQPAPPFAILPPREIAPGPISFDLKLFFPSTAQLPDLLNALADACSAGLGRDRIPIRGLRIDSLGAGDAAPRPVFDGGAILPHGAAIFPGDRLAGAPADGSAADVRLSLLTPLRMKESGRLLAGFPFERIARAALRRLTSLGALIGQAWPRSWSGPLQAAGRVETSEERTRWMDWGRFSKRQGRAMRLGGAVGEILYRGVPCEFLPLLRAAAFAQLGKNVTFGLGAITVEEIRRGEEIRAA